MKKIAMLTILFCVSVIFNITAFAWEPYDRVIAVVNNRPIVESEVDFKVEQKNAGRKLSAKKLAQEKSRVIDYFIENLLVDETAEEQSIVISDMKVIDHLEKIMQKYFSTRIKDSKQLEKTVSKTSERLKFWLLREREEMEAGDNDKKLDKDLDSFIAYVEKNQKTDFGVFVDDLRASMKRELVMSIAIGVSPPSREEAKKWYAQNRAKLGYEVRVKHILVRPKGQNFTAEKKANDILQTLRKRILKGESFEKLAAKYSEDPGSKVKGGDIGWVMLGELDPYFAGNVYRMTRRGQISQVFKSGFGYHVVKYLGKRAVTYDRVERMIMYKLHNEKLMEQFKKWIARKKKQSDIKIFLDSYASN